MFGATATPAFGVAPSQFGAHAPGGMFGAAPAAAAAATGGGFESTGGGMFGQRATAPTFGALGAPAAFGSTGGGFCFGAPQVRAPSTPPRSLTLAAAPHRSALLRCSFVSVRPLAQGNAVTAVGENWRVRRIIGPVILRGGPERRLQLPERRRCSGLQHGWRKEGCAICVGNEARRVDDASCGAS